LASTDLPGLVQAVLAKVSVAAVVVAAWEAPLHRVRRMVARRARLLVVVMALVISDEETLPRVQHRGRAKCVEFHGLPYR
jgi:hypothetical protein